MAIGIGPDMTTFIWVAVISASFAVNVILAVFYLKERNMRQEIDKVIEEDK